MGQRVKGQEVELVMLVDGLPQDNMNLVQNLEFTFKTELLQEGYLGEMTDRYDMIYRGVGGKAQYHFDTTQPFVILKKILDKARRRVPGTRFNFKCTSNLPSGRRARIVIPDVEFGPLPFNVGSRSAYQQFSVDFAASDAYVLAT